MASHENTNPKLSVLLSLPIDSIYNILSRVPVMDLLRLRSVCKSLLSLISNPEFVKAGDIIMYNIFLRFSVKYLSQLMLVCKSWLSVISSRDFIRTHLAKSTNDPHFIYHHLILNMGPYDSCGLPCIHSDRIFTSLSVYSLLNEPVTENFYLDCPMEDSYFLVGYCHGLICLKTATVDEDVCLWNPYTGKSRILPKFDAMNLSPCGDTVHGFSYDESNDDFKVFAIFGYKEYKVSVYSLKSDSWRIIGDFSFGLVTEDGKFANGAIHWRVTRNNMEIIVTLDIQTETCREFLLPKYGEGADHMTIGTFDKSFSILYKFGTYADLWVMKECGAEGCWRKLFTIPYMNAPFLDITSISVNGNIILNLGLESCIKLYYPKGKTFKDLFCDSHLHLDDVYNYVESLVSPYP